MVRDSNEYGVKISWLLEVAATTEGITVALEGIENIRHQRICSETLLTTSSIWSRSTITRVAEKALS